MLSYDFIYLLIAIAATLLFVFETLYRVYNLYTTNGRSLSRRKKRTISNNGSQQMMTEDNEDLANRVMQALAEYQWKSSSSAS